MEIRNTDSNGGRENIACIDKANQMNEGFQRSLPLNQNDDDLSRPLSNQRFKIQNANRIRYRFILTTQIKHQKQNETKKKKKTKSITTQQLKNHKKPPKIQPCSRNSKLRQWGKGKQKEIKEEQIEKRN